MASEKISLYSLSELKNTADDALPNYLNSLKFKQSHTLSDVRLALGYSAFFLAAACFFWDYQLGFESTKYYTAAAVAVYSVLNGALTFWMFRVEKGTVYQGTAPSGEQISIATTTKKNDPTYRLTITVTSKSSPKQTYELNQPFNTFYNEAGFYVAQPFQVALASTVPLVGKHDPKRVKLASQELLNDNPALLDAVLAANASTAQAVSTESEVKDKTGGKAPKSLEGLSKGLLGMVLGIK